MNNTTTTTISNNLKDKEIFENISASSWVIYDYKRNIFMRGSRGYQKRQIASLTKIMTCFTVIHLCEKYCISPRSTMVTVSDVASDIRGTTAGLQKGDVLSVGQLLHGLMLPSGNDAAFALAQHFGRMLYKKKYTYHDIKQVTSF